MKKIGLYFLFIMGLASLSYSVAAYDFNAIDSSDSSDSTNVDAEDDGYGVDVNDYIAEDGRVDVDGINKAYKDAEDAMMASEEGRDNPFKLDGDTTTYINESGSLQASGYKSKISKYVSTTSGGTSATNIWSYSPIGSLTGTQSTGDIFEDTTKTNGGTAAISITGSSSTSHSGSQSNYSTGQTTMSGSSGSAFTGTYTPASTGTVKTIYVGKLVGTTASVGKTTISASGSSSSSQVDGTHYYSTRLEGTTSTGSSTTVYTGHHDNSTPRKGSGIFFTTEATAASAGTTIRNAVNLHPDNYYEGYTSYNVKGKIYNIDSTSVWDRWSTPLNINSYTSFTASGGGVVAGGAGTTVTQYTGNSGTDSGLYGTCYTTSSAASSSATAIKNAVNASASNYYVGYGASDRMYSITTATYESRSWAYHNSESTYSEQTASTASDGKVTTTGGTKTSNAANKVLENRTTTTAYVAHMSGVNTATSATTPGSTEIFSGSVTENGHSLDTVRGTWFTTADTAAKAAEAIKTAVNRHSSNYYVGYSTKTATSTVNAYYIGGTATSASNALNNAPAANRFGSYSVSGGGASTYYTYPTHKTMYTGTLTSSNTTSGATTPGSTTYYLGAYTNNGSSSKDSVRGKWFTTDTVATAAATAVKNAVNASSANYFAAYSSTSATSTTNVYHVGGAGNASGSINYITSSYYFGGSSVSAGLLYSKYQTTTYTQSTLTTAGLTSYANAKDYSFGGTGDNQHSAIINSAGDVYTAGYNTDGQLGAGNTTNSGSATAPNGYAKRTLPGSVKGVRVETGINSTIVLGADGNLYGTGKNIGAANATSFTKLTVTGAAAGAQIVDFKVGSDSVYVLYSDGTIFRGTTSFTKISGSIEFAMIDIETTSNRLYAVSSDNKVYTGSSSLTVLNVTPAADIIQIRGGYSQWGYLTDENIFYRATSSTGTPAQKETNVIYFDMGATNYAFLKGDKSTGGEGTGGTITKPDDFDDDYHSNTGLTRNTPPTITKCSQSNSTGNELSPAYGETIELEFTEYLVFDYTWFVTEKFDQNKQQRITNVITGAGFAGAEWITDGTPKPAHTIFPKNVGEYSYSAQLQEYKNGQWEDVGNAYEVSFEITKTTAEFSLNETELTALVSDYVMENNGRNTYQLIMDEITANTYTKYLKDAPKVYQVSGGSYVTKDVTAFATYWEVYMEKEDGTRVTNDATMGTSGTFNIVFKFNAGEVANYTTDTIEKFEFNIEAKEFGLTNDDIELNENKEKYSQTASSNTDGSSIEFAFTHYINITNNMYRDSVEHTIGDTITKIVITGANGFSYTIANYDEADLDAVWSYLPKAVGTYTATASFKVNGHTFEETISLTYNITKAQPELEITDNLIESLENTVLNSGVNSVPNMITTVINGIKASGTGSTNPFVVFTPTMNTLEGTTLTEINFTNDIYWNVVFTKTNTVGADPVTNITNQPGTYYVWVSFDVSKVDPTFTNYHPVAAVVAEFTIAGRTNELTEDDFGIVANTVTGHYVTDVDYLDSIEFGNTYLFNISNELYNNEQDTISAVVKLKGSNTILANIFYNSLENNAENANGSSVADSLPKAVGTYVIYVSITNSDGHEYGTVEKEYSITKATPTVTINAAMESYLENILINNGGVISTYKLINQVTNEIEAGIDEDGFVSVSKLFSTSGSDLTEITTISKNSWKVYFTHGGNSAAERLTELVPNTTYYVWVVFDSNDGNYETSEAVGRSFTVAPRSITLNSSALGGTYDENKYSTNMVNSFAFGVKYYFNLSSNTYAGSDYSQMITVDIDGVTVSFDYNEIDKNKDAYELLPKNGGVYTFTLTVVSTDDGHAYGDVSTDITIIKSNVTISEDRAVIAKLNETKKMGELNLVESLIGKILNPRTEANYTYLQIITPQKLYKVVEVEGVANGTTLVEITIADTLKTDWEIHFTPKGSENKLDVINQAGEYTVYIKLNGLGGYNDSNYATFDFTIGEDDNDTGEGSDFSEASIGISTSKDKYATESLTEVDFGAEYYVNLNSNRYSAEFKQVVTIMDANERVFATYNYDTTEKGTGITWAQMPKAIGTYTIVYEIQDKTTSETQIILEAQYEIVKATSNLIISNELLAILAAQVVVATDLNDPSKNKELIDDMYGDVATAIGYNTRSNVAAVEFTPALQVYNPTTNSLSNLLLTDTSSANWTIAFTEASATDASDPLTSIKTGGDYKVWIGLVGIAGYEDIAAVSGEFHISTRNINDDIEIEDEESTIVQVKPNNDGTFPLDINGNELKEIDKESVDAEIFVKGENGIETEAVYDENNKLVLPQLGSSYVWEVSKDVNGNIIVTASNVIAVYQDPNNPELIGNAVVAAGKDLIVIHLDESEERLKENTIANGIHTVERIFNENTVEYKWQIFQNEDGTATVSAMKKEGAVDENDEPVTDPEITTAPGKEDVYIDLGFDPMGTLDRDEEGNLIIPALTDGYTNYETDRTADGYTVIRPFKNVTVYDYEGVELNVIKLTTRVQAHLYDVAGAYVSVLNPSLNNTITLSVLPEGCSAWKFGVDANGNHTITPIEDATKTFGPESLGISIYTTKYSPKSVDSVGFGQVYYLNINSTYFSDTTKYSQIVKYEDINGVEQTLEYDEIDKTETGLWLELPKVAGEYTISLTIIDKLDGHNYGTITKKYFIVETKTNIEIHEDLVYEIQKNKILEENLGVTNVFPEVNAIIENGLTDANRLITVNSDTGSFMTFDGNDFITYNFNYQEDLTYQIVDVNGNDVNNEITQWGDYKIIFTYEGVVGHYEGFTYEVAFTISDRAYYTTAQIGITLDGSSRVENTVGFSEQHFVYLNNREITSETHLVTYTVTGANDFKLEVNYWQYDLQNTADKTALWNKMPKQIGTYTITVKVIELVDGEQVIVNKEMVNTYTITPNRTVAIVCDAANQEIIRQNLNTISAANGENLISSFDELLLTLVNVNYTLSVDLFTPTADITTIVPLDVKVANLWTYTYYDENNNKVDSITTEGTYQVKITFNGTEHYNSATTSFIVFTIGNRPALIRNDIYIKYEGKNEALEQIEFAELVNSRFFVSINRTGAGQQFQHPRYEIDIKITLKDSTRSIVSYEYFTANLDTVWAQMPKEAGVYTMHVTLKDSTDPIPFNTLTKDFTITENEFDITAVNGNLANDVNNTLSLIGTNGTANNNRLVEALNGLLVPSYFKETIFAAGATYTVGTYTLDYAFFNEDGSEATSITSEGKYFVVISLTAKNYTCAPSQKLEFNVRQSIKLADENALFEYTSGNDTNTYDSIPYFTGTEYGILINDIAKLDANADISTFDINVKIVNDATTEQFEIDYNYETETDVWSKMPKYVGKYNVTVTLTETMNGFEFPKSETYSILEIKKDNEITINENTAAIEDKLSGFLDEAGNNILPKLKDQITVDLLTLDKEIYIAAKDGRTQVFTGTKELNIDDFEIKFFKDGNEVTEITEAGDYTVTITFKGVYGIYATSEYGFPILVNVAERIVVSAQDSIASFEVTSQFTPVDNVKLFNGGERYYFVVNDLKGATSILDMNTNKVVIILTSDKGLAYSFDYTYAEGGRDETTLNNIWAAIPKVAGEYSVDVQVTYKDKLGDYVLVTRLNNTLNINPLYTGMNLQDNGTNLEIEYNSKELATTLVDRFSTDTVVLTDANGNRITQVYLLNSQNQLELVDITMEMFDIVFTDKDGNVVEYENLTEEGDYKVTVSLKEEYNTGYAGQMSYSQDFTVTPYEKAFDYRGFAIALILILAVIAVIVVRKMRR